MRRRSGSPFLGATPALATHDDQLAERALIYETGAEVWMDTGARVAPLALSDAEAGEMRRLERRLLRDIDSAAIHFDDETGAEEVTRAGDRRCHHRGARRAWRPRGVGGAERDRLRDQGRATGSNR